MTDKMRCCFCGAELKEWDEWGTPAGLSCPNACKTRQIMDKEIWQALISGKKAQDALNRIERILLLDSEKPMTLTPAGKKEIKEIIASITKEDKK